jgi:hypothetical protein
MNVVAFIEFPPYVPTVICYLIYLYSGIQTKSCLAISSHINQTPDYNSEVETLWSFNIRQIMWYKLPPYLRNYPWQNRIEYDIGLAYHTSMRDHMLYAQDETIFDIPYHEYMIKIYLSNIKHHSGFPRNVAFIAGQGQRL